MKQSYNYQLSVEFETVFEENPQNWEAYLEGISRPILLKLATFFLGFSNKNSRYNDYETLITTFFSAENIELKERIRLKLSALKEKHQAELRIINPFNSLKLFEYTFNNIPEGGRLSDAESEINIFKAYLVLNSKASENERIAFSSTENLEPNIYGFAAMTFSQAYPYSELVNYDPHSLVASQLIKSIYLFEYLESDNQMQSLLRKFLLEFNCANWQTFLKRYLPLIGFVLNAEHEAHIDITINEGEGFDQSCNFLEKLIVADETILADYDFKKIRSRPFYKVERGVYRVIFGLFLIEVIHKGLYFKLSELNNLLVGADKIPSFRGIYCDKFSEQQLLYSILKSIYQGRYIEFSGREMKAHNIIAEPDYYIRKSNCIFLFESKDILINAEIKPSHNFDLYSVELKKKLYSDVKPNGQIDKKAVLQLINNVERILTKQFAFDTKYKERNVYIYPILVLHDHQFDVFGLNAIVNRWFNDELEKLKAKGINTHRVQPLAIINIDTLIFHQDLLRDRKIYLEVILDEYFKSVKYIPYKPLMTKEQVEKNMKRTVVSLGLFFDNYVAVRKMRKVPKMLMEQGRKLFVE